jgi:DNA-binding transcriptional MerR regulator
MSKAPRRPVPPAAKAAPGRPTYTLDAAASAAGVQPEMVRFYVESGVVATFTVVRGQPRLDDDALYELRRIEHYRRHYGVNRQALPVIGTLLRELARLEAEVRFHSH